MASTMAVKLALSFSSPKLALPKGACTMPDLSILNSTLPALSSATAFLMSKVTVPSFGFGITTEPLTIWSGCFGSTPRRAAMSAVSSNLALADAANFLMASSMPKNPSPVFSFTVIYLLALMAYYPSTLIPMLLAVPSMVFIAASIVPAVMSGIFRRAISSTCRLVTVPTLSLFGTLEPFSAPMAFKRSVEAGGVFVMNENVLSAYTVMTTDIVCRLLLEKKRKQETLTEA